MRFETKVDFESFVESVAKKILTKLHKVGWVAPGVSFLGHDNQKALDFIKMVKSSILETGVKEFEGPLLPTILLEGKEFRIVDYRKPKEGEYYLLSRVHDGSYYAYQWKDNHKIEELNHEYLIVEQTERKATIEVSIDARLNTDFWMEYKIVGFRKLIRGDHYLDENSRVRLFLDSQLNLYGLVIEKVKNDNRD